MIYRRNVSTRRGMKVSFSTTWEYKSEFITDACYDIIKNDFGSSLVRACVIMEQGGKKQEILDDVKVSETVDPAVFEKLAKGCDEAIIAGYSKIMDCPIEFHFSAGTNVVELTCLKMGFFNKKGKHAFDVYMDSIEINAYCRDVRRKTSLKYENNDKKILDKGQPL